MKGNQPLIIELRAKWEFIKIQRKYKMEKELQKMDPKNGFRDIKLRRGGPLFIDTWSKSWPSD